MKIPKDISDILVKYADMGGDVGCSDERVIQAIAEYTDRKVREAKIDGAIEEVESLLAEQKKRKYDTWFKDPLPKHLKKLKATKAKLGDKDD